VSQEENTTVTVSVIEADSSREVTGAGPVETTGIQADGAVNEAVVKAVREPEVDREPEAPAAEAPELVSEVAMAEAEPPAPTGVAEAAEAPPEAEGISEAPQATEAEPEKQLKAEESESEKPAIAKKKRKGKKSSGPKTPLSELEVGAEIVGRVVGIADFGAFVDIGAETDGLIHISELSEERVNKVSDVVKPGQEVPVWIKDIDMDQERISLSMKPKPKYRLSDLKPGMIVEGVVTGIREYGVFVDIGAETEGLVHISEMADDYVNRPAELVSTGDAIEVQIKKVNRRKRRISLSMKGASPPPPPPPQEAAERSLPTAMELALRRALGAREGKDQEVSGMRVDTGETSRDELGEVFTRMLQQYRKDEETSET
jgi:predicted RNA-binding protein with RPS1 domain